jgi:hypothetical protein
MAVEMPTPMPRWALLDDQQRRPGDLIALSPATTTVAVCMTVSSGSRQTSLAVPESRTFSLHLHDFAAGTPLADVPLPGQPGQLLFNPDGTWLLALPTSANGVDIGMLLSTMTLIRAPWNSPRTVALSAPQHVPWGGRLEAFDGAIGGRWLSPDESLVATTWRVGVDTPNTGLGNWPARTLVLMLATTGLVRVLLERQETLWWMRSDIDQVVDQAASNLGSSATGNRADETELRLTFSGKQGIVQRRVDDRYREWLKWEVGDHGRSCDVGRVHGVEFVALTKPPRVYQLPDVDETWVYTGDADLRARAATSLGDRKTAASVPHLGHLLKDAEPPVRAAAIKALARIGDHAALALLVRAVGDLSQPDADLVVQELRTAAPLTLARVAAGCLRESKQGARRGAVRMLQRLPVVPATLLLRSLLTDQDPVIRCGALLGLGERRSLRVTPQVMARLADAEPDVAAAAWGSLVDILNGNGLLSRNDIRAAGSWPDIMGYARTLVASGVLDVAGQDHPAARFCTKSPAPWLPRGDR